VLPFVGLVPLTLWLSRLPGDRSGRAGALRGGFLFGVVYFGTLLHWLPLALGRMSWLAVPVYVLVLVGLAGLAAFFLAILHHAIVGLRAPVRLALPVVWTGFEWTRSNLPSTLAFPWLGLGTSLTGFPEIVGIAELVGARGVTFWIAAVNGLLCAALLRRREGRSVRVAMVWTVAVVTLPAAWGVWRAGTLATRAIARVAVVQPDMPASRGAPDPWTTEAVARAERLASRVPASSADLIVLPEGLIRADPGSPVRDSAFAGLRRVAGALGAPVLFGATAASASPPQDRRALYNSAFVTEPHGLSDFRYDKHRLVPLVERPPLLPVRLAGIVDVAGALSPGRGWPLASVGAARVGVHICYESSFPGASRALRDAGADIIVNITNDAWYGGPSIRTGALWQHPAHLVMRAIENRVGIVRAANSGVSFFVDPVGRIHGATPLFDQVVRVEDVRTSDVVTVYTRYGDLLGPVCALAAVALLVGGLAPRRRSDASP